MRKLSLLFAFLLTMFAGTQMLATEITVCDGTTTSQYQPVYGYYVDTQGCISEFIIPATKLESIDGATISQMTFYLSTTQSGAWGNAVFEVYMKEVTATTFSSATANTEGTNNVVYSGSLDGSQSTMVVPFSTNYTYNGGNLLIGFKVTTKGTYKGTYFYGESQEYTSKTAFHYGNNYNSGTDNFLPKVTFTYSLSSDPPVTPTGFAASTVTYKSATFGWTNGGTENKWQIRYKADGDADYTNTGDIAENPYTLTGLAANTKYYASIRSKMRSADFSDWSSDIEFTTPATPVIAVPTGLTANNITSTSANITWTSSESAWQIKYKAEGDADYCAPIDVTTNPYALTGLTANTKYYVSILAVADELTSSWSADAEFTTPKVAAGGNAAPTEVTEDFDTEWPCQYGTTLSGAKEGWGYVNAIGRYSLSTNDEYRIGGDGYALYCSDAQSSGNKQYIVTPAIKANTTISFHYNFSSTSSNGYIRLYKATKNGDTYSVDTSIQYGSVYGTKNASSIEIETPIEINEEGYVAIYLARAAIDDFVYTPVDGAAPTVTVVTGTNGYATFESASPLDLTTANLPQGLVAYSATVNGNQAQFTKLNQTVPAHTGILLEGAPYTEYQIATATTGNAVSSNDFFTVDGNTIYASDNTTFYFALKKDSDPMEFQKISTAGVKLPAGKAYLEASASAFSSGARLNISFDDAATGIENVNRETTTNNGCYNLNGQRVENPTKGLYIVNGKKVIIK